MTEQVEITDLSRERGYWTARVSIGRLMIEVDRRYGSWMEVVGSGGREVCRRELLPHVAAALQERVRPIESRERRERAAQKGKPNMFKVTK
jgi:hypothetical protein